MEEFEELQRKLAELVVFIRGDTRCWQHPHVSFMMMTADGHVPWHGPVYELPNDEQIVIAGEFFACDWQDEKKRLVEEAVGVLGGPDMSRFL